MREKERFEGYHSILCTNDQECLTVKIWNINHSSCPGFEFCSGYTNTAFNAISSALNLHNNTMDTSLTTEVLNSLTAFLTDTECNSLHEEVFKTFLYPPHNMAYAGTFGKEHGSASLDTLTYTHIYSWHSAPAATFNVAPLPLTMNNL